MRRCLTSGTTRRPAAGRRSHRLVPRVRAAARLPATTPRAARSAAATRTARRPRRCGSATGRRAGTCASSRTCTRRSSGRRSSIHGPEHVHSIGELARHDARPRRRGMAAPRARRRRHLLPVDRTKGTRQAPRCRTPTRSSRGSRRRRPPLRRSAGCPSSSRSSSATGVSAGCPRREPRSLRGADRTGARREAAGLRSDLLAPALRLLAELVRRLQRVRRRSRSCR